MTSYKSTPDSIISKCRGHSYEFPNSLDLDDGVLLKARNIKLFLNGKLILENINFDIHEREIVTLIGPNGSGKTSLVRVLLGISNATSGHVYRRSGLKIGYVPQRFDLDQALPITVERFLSLGTRVDTTKIVSALKEVGADRCIKQQLVELSGGEVQRILLARSLISNPALVVLDEPTRGLDYGGAADLYSLIENMRDTRGLGVLLVSHDLHVVMGSSNRVLCLNRHICCSGKPDMVSQHPEYTKMFGLKSANALGVYHHKHDHVHGLDGAEFPISSHTLNGNQT